MSGTPLSSVRILDLTDEAVALAPRLLSDMGATVIRAESTTADGLRRRGPFLDDRPGLEQSLAHLNYNAGKRSLAVDLARSESWDVLARLVDAVELVFAPLEKSPLASAFFDAQRFEAAHPHVNVVDTVFRRNSSHAAVVDLVGVAAGGLLYLNGFPEDPPNLPAGKLAYKQASLAAALAGVSLVLGARRTGQSSRATVCVQEAVAFTTLQTANENYWHWHQTRPGRTGFRGLGRPGSRSIFQCRDGAWVSVSIHPPYWRQFAAWVTSVTGCADLQELEWSDANYRLEHPARIAELIQEVGNRLTRDEMLRQGQQALVLIGPVNNMADIACDDQLGDRGVFRNVSHPQLGRDLTLVRPPFFSSAYEPPARPAPALGADSVQVLTELAGMDADVIGNLVGGGVVGARAMALDKRASVSTASRPSTTIAPCTGGRNLPLQGYRILDFCWLIAGPLTTRLLADMGAEVIRIESMARVDRIREAGVQPPRGFSLETNGVFNDCNTNKQSLTIDLNRPGAIDLIKQLVPHCDAVTSNFRPGRMERWGLGYADLRQLRSDIVVLNLPAFGRGGPKEGWGLVGNGIVAMAGLNTLTGFPDRPPIGLATLHADFVAPYFGAMAVVAALLQRELSAEGQHVEVSQYEAAIQLLDTQLLEHLSNGVEPARRGNRSAEMVPHGVFACRGDDRWVAIAARDSTEWQQLAMAMERPDLALRPDLQSIDGRRACEDDLEHAITAWTSVRDNWEIAHVLQARGVPASPVEDVGDLVARDEGMLDHYARLEHPYGIDLLAQYQPVTWNGDRLPIARAPLVGEHNRQVLGELLHLDDARFDELVASGVIA
jgi:benzylsuccinate CoA-transferase BbsF subunit